MDKYTEKLNVVITGESNPKFLTDREKIAIEKCAIVYKEVSEERDKIEREKEVLIDSCKNNNVQFAKLAEEILKLLQEKQELMELLNVVKLACDVEQKHKLYGGDPSHWTDKLLSITKTHKMEKSTIKNEWYNGTTKGDKTEWPSLKELKFCYSHDQREITLSHQDNKKIGITFTDELTKRFDLYPSLLEDAIGTAKKNNDLLKEKAELLEALRDIRNWYEQRGSAQLHPETPVCFSKALSIIQKHS